MGSKTFRFYMLLAVLVLVVGVPLGRHEIQKISIGQDIRGISLEYSLKGPKWFRERLDEVLRRARLDPKDVEIQIKENKQESKVLIEVRYVTRHKILFFPLERSVVIQRQIRLYPGV